MTIRWRSEFQIFTDTTNYFKYYQLHPLKIPFIDINGKRRFYEPLVLLTFWDDHLSPRNRPSVLADVRSDAEIKSNAEFLIPAFRAAHRFAQRRKLCFRIFRNRFFASQYFLNLAFIKPYRILSIDPDNRILIKDTLKQFNKVKMSQFIDLLRISLSTNEEKQIIQDIWVLIQQGEIKTNWNKPFGEDSILWV